MPATLLRNLRLSAFLLLGVCFLWSSRAEALRVTELMAINNTTIADEDGEFSDWVEIHNDSGGPASLAGWYLTDSPADPTRWQFPAVNIPTGGYLLVWASGKNRAGTTLHTSFRLSGDGEYLALVRPDGVTIEHAFDPSYPPQTADVSFGLASDLVTERCFLDPTPGAPNDETRGCGRVEDVTFSVTRGYYDAPFTVEMTTATPGAEIRYTTDGSAPTQENGTLYTGPILISTTTPLRAAGFKPDFVPTRVFTHTYIFLDDVLQQSIASLPPAYPAKWGGGQGADYDMDPDVVNDPLYAPEIKDDLRSIPAMSVVMDAKDLFDPQIGIYTHTMRRGPEWERASSVEIIFGDGSADDAQVDAGIRIQGELSRASIVKKHSFRLSFKNEFGPPVWQYPFFSDSDVERFDQLTLTGGHGNSWHGGYKTAQYIRDTWCKDTQLAMGQLAPHSRYVHLYLNGLYWGLYRVTERPAAGFLAEHLGGEKEDFDVIKASEVVDGDRQAWDTLQALANGDLSSLSAYQAIQGFVDIDNLIDYFLVNLYGNNTDWDAKNWYAGRRRAPGAGYMFFCWDAEDTLAGVNGNRISINNHDSPSSIFSDLRKKSPEFRLRMADRIHKHMFNDGALTPRQVIARWMRRSDEIFGAIVGESARWGDKARARPYTRDNEWLVERQRLILSLFPRRTQIFFDALKRDGLYPDVDAPEFNQHGGDVPPGFAVAISAPAGTIYYDDQGGDPRLAGGAIAPNAKLYAGPITINTRTRIAARALVAASEWSALTEAEFMVDRPIRVSEIMFHPSNDAPLEYIEITNTGTTSVDLKGFAFTDGVSFSFPSWVLAPGNYVLVVQDAAAFAAHYGTGLPIAGAYIGRLSNGGERLVLEAPDGSVIHDFIFSDDWFPATDGGGHSLVIRTPTLPKSVWSEGAGWRPSSFVDGSPGAEDPRLCANGIDDDGDGSIDLNDPGCASSAGDDEAPQCNDGVDNDEDGATDLNDSDCLSAAQPIEAPPAIDSYACYQSRQNAQVEKFEPLDVVLDDPVEGSGTYTVRRPRGVCVATAVDGTAIVDEFVHLDLYDIAATDTSPPVVPLEDVRIESEKFGPLFVDKSRPERLLVPSSVSESGPVSAPDFGSHDLDVYKCYRVRFSRGTPKYFPSGTQVALENLFETRDVRVKPPKHVCAPADFAGQGIKSSQRFLGCYPLRKAKFASKHTARVGVHSATALGPLIHDTRREHELCVPLRVTYP